MRTRSHGPGAEALGVAAEALAALRRAWPRMLAADLLFELVAAALWLGVTPNDPAPELDAPREAVVPKQDGMAACG